MAETKTYDASQLKIIIGVVEVTGFDEGDFLVVNGDNIHNFGQRDPAQIPWGQAGVDVVLECSKVIVMVVRFEL